MSDKIPGDDPRDGIERPEFSSTIARTTHELHVRPGSHESIQPSNANKIGLGIIVGILLGVVGPILALAYPPWSRTYIQKRQVLYWSEDVKVLRSEFDGYDFLLSSSKWRNPGTDTLRASESYFNAMEYRLNWPRLVTEWVLLEAIAAAGVVLALRKRNRQFVLDTGSLADKRWVAEDRIRWRARLL
jgi:hypothetical protein